ncbi:MAG: 4-hydroxy-tetrahydrodipicolinate reductase [Cryomorphaceae bacterium]
MNIGIIGYGKMGMTIEEIALERGHSIIAKLTSASTDADWDRLNDADVCIEFTNPASSLENFKYCMENGFALVTGTTGWYEHMDKVERWQEKYHGSFFWASNFSVGVNLFWQVNKRLAELMNDQPDYSVSIREIHHTEKKDAPSGTAITTAEQILQAIPDLSGWKLKEDKPKSDEIEIEALREKDVKGTHTVRYESDIDSIEITHAANSRKGFALGAVLAAEFLQGQKGFFTMEDLLG